MAMSRILSQTLLRPSYNPRAVIIHHRHRSNKTHQAQLIEVDLDSSSPPESAEEVITVIKKLEEEIHSILIQQAAPDWLPFLPGYSYWVPPQSSTMRRPHGMFEVIGKMNSLDVGKNRAPQFDLLTEDETMSFTSSRGWPSSTYFFEGASPHQIPLMEVQVKIQNEVGNAYYTANSEDEEA